MSFITFTIYSRNMAICLAESEMQFAHFQIKLRIDCLTITQSRINYRYLTPKQTGLPPWQKRRLCIQALLSGWLRTPLPRIHKIVLPLIRRLTGPVGYHYVIELLIPCYMTTMMHGLYLHIFLFCFYGGTYKFYSFFFFFPSVSFLFCLIVANSEYLCFRCTVF